MTTTYIDYPFTANGINFISRIYDNFHLAKEIQNIPSKVFQELNSDAIRDTIGDVSKLSNVELLNELDRVNAGGTGAFILLGENS